MKILVAHDGSEQSNKALKKAVEFALKTDSSLTIFSVVPDLCMIEISEYDCTKIYETMTEESNERVRVLKEELLNKGLKVDTDVQFGNAAEMIVKTCNDKKIDMVVVGSHGRHGIKKFLLGSVSSKVVEHAPCDVMVVK